MIAYTTTYTSAREVKAIYRGLRNCYSGPLVWRDACWAICGLAIRAAQEQGMPQDNYQGQAHLSIPANYFAFDTTESVLLLIQCRPASPYPISLPLLTEGKNSRAIKIYK